MSRASQWHLAHPEVYRALAAVNNAIKRGRLIKSPCHLCGSTIGLRCQHADYSRPLEVTWLCRRCYYDTVKEANVARRGSGEYRRCSIAGCDRKHFCHGYCKLHYDRKLRLGDPLAPVLPMRSRGEAMAWLRINVSHGDESTCLIWPFRRHPDGRAQMSRGFAARVMCKLAHGDPPSPQHQAAHACGNGHGGCVNPCHLRWATPAENAADKEIHGTVINGERHHSAKLTERDVRHIRALATLMYQKDIAAHYGLQISCISKIVNRLSWKHVP